MAQFIEGTLDWSDNSSGVADETGQEIQIYTDSPSFVPDVPIDYTEAPNPWMRLPFVNAGVTTAGFKLETPVTFIVVRVRQFNADGNGEWSNPQGSRFSITQTSGANRPPAPTNVGFAVVGTGTITPPPPPPDPPPPPPPTGGGGSSSNYSLTAQFSGVQGQSGWSYLDGAGNQLTYDSANSIWRGDELYLAIWNGGFRHSSSGTIKDAVARWTAPSAGTALVSGTAQLFSAPGSVRFVAKHNSTTKFTSTDMTTTTAEPYSFSAVMSAGDTLDFISQRVAVSVYNNNMTLNPTINFTTDGSTPANPTVGSLSPSSATVSVGGTQSLTVTLTSAPSANATVALSSSDVTKATVPATVSVPAGQLSATVPVTGVAAGSSTITATYNSTEKTSAITVANPATGTWPNVPAGWSVLNDHDHSVITGNGWLDYYNITSVVSDSTAPVSPSSVMQQTFALGLVGGNGGGGGNTYVFPSAVNGAYWGFAFKTDSNYEQHPSGTKIGWIHNRLNGSSLNNQFILLMQGTYPNFYMSLVYQNGNIDNSHIGGQGIGTVLFYPQTGGISPGQWVKVETVLIPSTTNVSRNGIWRCWINGVVAHNITTLNTDRIQPDGVSHITIWGGVGGTKQRNSYLYFDHSRVCVP